MTTLFVSAAMNASLQYFGYTKDQKGIWDFNRKDFKQKET